MDINVNKLAGGLKEMVKLELRWHGNWPPSLVENPARYSDRPVPAVPARPAVLGSAAQERREPAGWERSREESRRPPQPITARRLAVADQFKGPKGKALKELAAEVAACKRCPLHKTRTQTVFGVGKVDDGGLVLVGEAPGHEEDVQGEPFVGAAGRLLDRLLEKARTARAGVFIGIVLKCRPPGNRPPQPLEAAMCLPFLRRQIEIIKPTVFCALGRHAVHALTGRDEAMGRLRGTIQEFEGVPVVVTYHPAYLLRNPTATDEVIHDLAKAWEMLPR